MYNIKANFKGRATFLYNMLNKKNYSHIIYLTLNIPVLWTIQYFMEAPGIYKPQPCFCCRPLCYRTLQIHKYKQFHSYFHWSVRILRVNTQKYFFLPIFRVFFTVPFRMILLIFSFRKFISYRNRLNEHKLNLTSRQLDGSVTLTFTAS